MLEKYQQLLRGMYLRSLVNDCDIQNDVKVEDGKGGFAIYWV